MPFFFKSKCTNVLFREHFKQDKKVTYIKIKLLLKSLNSQSITCMSKMQSVICGKYIALYVERYLFKISFFFLGQNGPWDYWTKCQVCNLEIKSTVWAERIALSNWNKKQNSDKTIKSRLSVKACVGVIINFFNEKYYETFPLMLETTDKIHGYICTVKKKGRVQ